jgi:hypothetical protein
MSVEASLTAPVESLVDRHVAEVVSALARRHRRQLDDNPDGSAVIAAGVRAAVMAGIVAQSHLEGLPAGGLEAAPNTWEQWQLAKAETPEALEWPEELVRRDPAAVNRAGELLAWAGRQLGMHGRELGDLHAAGEQAAEAGAALVRSIAHPQAGDPEPVPAKPASLGDVAPNHSVEVAIAANQAECELIQGRLQAAGIPSAWRRIGTELPHFGAGGYRSIYVPPGAAAEAQLLLATRDSTASTEPADPVTRRIGLERTGIRLAGKATATLMLLGLVTAAIVAFTYEHTAIAIVSLAAFVVVIAAIVAWSERAASEPGG